MITWIQIRVQKHLKLLFASLLVVMVVTFVLTIGNQSFFGSHGDNQFKAKDFYGYNLANEGTKSYLNTVAQISLQLNPEFRYTGLVVADVEEYAHDRAVALSLAKSLGIAEPDEDQLRSYIRGMMIFGDASGAFSAQRYKAVVESFRTGMRVPESTMLAVISDDYRIARVRALLGGAGFISPDFISLQRQEAGTEWTFSVAQVSGAAFNPHIQADLAVLKKFYDDNQARFQIPDMISLAQVRFPSVSFVAQVPQPTEEEIAALFERSKYRYRPANLQPDAEGNLPDFAMDDAIRARVSQDIVDMRAVQLAAEKADEFTMTLWHESVSSDSPRIAELAASMNAQVTQVPPFAKGNPPPSQDVRRSDIDQQWILATSERYFSDVIPGPTGASVFIFKSRIPARMPFFEEIQDKVAEVYVAERRSELFAAHGTELRAQLDAAVRAGTSFSDAAKALGLAVEDYSSLKMDAVPPELMVRGGPMEIVTRLIPGTVSAMQINPKGGFIVCLAGKNVPAMDTVMAKPEEIDYIRKGASGQDGWGVVNALRERRKAQLEAEDRAPKTQAD